MKLSPKQRKAIRLLHLAFIGLWVGLSLSAALLAYQLGDTPQEQPLAGAVEILGMFAVAATLITGGAMIYFGGRAFMRQPWMLAKLILIAFAIAFALACKGIGPNGPIISAAVVVPIIMLTGWMSHAKPLNYLKESGKHSLDTNPQGIRTTDLENSE